MKRILLLEPDSNYRQRTQNVLRSHSFDVVPESSLADALRLLAEIDPALVIASGGEPSPMSLELVRQARESVRPIPVLVLTNQESTRGAVEFMDAGAYDYRPKPADPVDLLQVVDEILKHAVVDRASGAPKSVLADETTSDGIIGSSPEMIEIFKLIGRIAKSEAAVLILGESGTGKELAARTIHETSHRADKPFLAVNCAAIPETLLESELFGHEKGAFTGATTSRRGKFEQTHGGTIFLDEVGDMSLSTQAKILRVLQEHTYERVGGEQTLFADTRIIAATNKSLVDLIDRKEFRVDLFYRLKVVSIYLPPLRKRPGDIRLLADHFVRKYASEARVRIRGVSNRAFSYLEGHTWTGNVRELENAIQTAVVLNRTGVLDLEDFPFLRERSAAEGGKSDLQVLVRLQEEARKAAKYLLSLEPTDAKREGNVYRTCVDLVEKALVEAGLEHCRGNQVQAARVLGMSRNTLRAKHFAAR